ncbi:8975_t:CDS:2, partial [Funneliformis mosseae]
MCEKGKDHCQLMNRFDNKDFHDLYEDIEEKISPDTEILSSQTQGLTLKIYSIPESRTHNTAHFRAVVAPTSSLYPKVPESYLNNSPMEN